MRRVLALAQFDFARVAGPPAVLPGPVADARAGRRLAEAVERLDRSRTRRVVRREPVRSVQPSVGLDRARHQVRARQRGPRGERGPRVHQQRRHARHRWRGHARTALGIVAATPALAVGGHHAHARADDQGCEPPVGGGPVAAEPGQFAAVQRRADGQRVLRGCIVGEPAVARVRVGDDVELPGVPYHGVELPGARAATVIVPRGGRQAHVDDRRPDAGVRPARAAACRRVAEEVHASLDGRERPPTAPAENLREADVRRQRGHSRVARFPRAVARDRRGHVRTVTVVVDPEILVLAENEVRPADTFASGPDVHVVDVQAAVHDADCHAAAREAVETACGGVVAVGVRPHGRYCGVVHRPGDADRLDEGDEVRGGDGLDLAVRHVGRVGARVGVVGPDHRAEVLQS